jgi:NDP-sugar pyrophosphorylase family protein
VASLGVQDRVSERQLLFDDAGLMGWEHRGSDGVVRDSRRVRGPAGPLRRWSFSGVHVVEPVVFDLSALTGRLPIRDLYLDLAQRGHRILPVDVSAHEWLDVGTSERLAEAEAREG